MPTFVVGIRDMNRDHNDIRSTIWRNDHVKGIDFYESSYAKFAFTPHFHEHYVFYIVLSGTNEVLFENTKYTVPKGEVLIINPGDVHTGNSLDGKPLLYRSLCIDQDFFKKTLQELHLDAPIPSFTSFHISDPVLANKIMRILNYSDMEYETLAVESACADLFGYALKQYSSSYKELSGTAHLKDKVAHLKDFIKANYDHNFSLKELSGYIQLSPYHLIRLFKAETGLTPYEYLRNYRVEQAKLLLKHTNNTIANVALTVGFYDQSHFHSHFKKLIGVTPRHFRTG